MTLQDLEYIIAVDQHRHFARAAESCHVTQPTLSMQLRKLEEELGVLIFDRSSKPVVPTDIGKRIIQQAGRVLQEARFLKDMAMDARVNLSGDLKIGIIPTLAPFLLPAFLKVVAKELPYLKLRVSELVTEEIVKRMQNGDLDMGILVTPVPEVAMRVVPLFYEEFFVYSSHDFDKEFILPEEIDPTELWLLEEGHCFRSQILNLCELRRKISPRFEYEAGSIETLKRLVDQNQGVTILPELAVKDFSTEEKRRLKKFQPPAPVREVSLVTLPHYARERLIDSLAQLIRQDHALHATHEAGTIVPIT
ncbi:MAG: LysR substrate-binding domain-containing protein [Bacteroidia bacterium]|nr:LysR substrate-binding domain-containing protein [Bacteroidia bacterium]